MTMFDFMINCIEEGIIVFCLYKMSSHKACFKPIYSIMYWIFLVSVVTLQNIFFSYNNVLEILILISNTIFLISFSSDNILGSFAKAILIQLLLLISAQLSLFLISVIQKIDFIFVDDSMYFQSAIVMSKVILLLLSLGAIKFFHRIGYVILNKTWFSIILGMVCVKSTLEINQKILITEKVDSNSIMTSSFLFLILCILLFKIFYDIELQLKEKMHYELTLKSYKTSLDNYQYLNEKNHELHTIKHDFKKVLSYYQWLLEQDEVDKAKDYLTKFTERIDAIHLPIIINHGIINMVINEKIFQAKRGNIDLKYIISSENLCKLNIDDIDLYILLDNLLNNAVENCVPHGLINIMITDHNKTIKFSISNTIKQTVLMQNPGLRTTKKDATEHGYGIDTIRKLIKKYNGSIKFFEQNHMFFCEFSIPMKDE